MKHRVWCKDKNEWESDSTFIGTDGSLYFRHFDRLQLANMANHILEFSTGFKDKNGNDIFDGDIVDVQYNYIGHKAVSIVGGMCNISGLVHSKLEIIGNIHEKGKGL